LLRKDNAQGVQISTKEYNFGSIDDLKEHCDGQPLFQLSIDSSLYAYIHLDRSLVSVRVSPGPQSAQIFHDIDEVLARRLRKPGFLYEFWLAIMPCWLACPLLFGLFGRPSSAVAEMLSSTFGGAPRPEAILAVTKTSY
jgi:hypothetical protein